MTREQMDKLRELLTDEVMKLLWETALKSHGVAVSVKTAIAAWRELLREETLIEKGRRLREKLHGGEADLVREIFYSYEAAYADIEKRLELATKERRYTLNQIQDAMEDWPGPVYTGFLRWLRDREAKEAGE